MLARVGRQVKEHKNPHNSIFTETLAARHLVVKLP
jgi:hypothetical protein